MAEIKKIFISYSHDTPEHKQRVRKLADQLIKDYGINVVADCYEEDNPTGGLLTNFMQTARETDRVICVLTPIYKLKADEAKGDVGYESSIITDELYKNISSDLVIPIIIDESFDIIDCTPNFLGSTRKIIVRKVYKTQELFIEEIARVIHRIPAQPKPILGKNKLLNNISVTQQVEDINIQELVINYKNLFENAKFYAKKGDEQSFRELFRKVKQQVFKNLNLCRLKNSIPPEKEEGLPVMMDKFIDIAAPLFLIPFAGYLSGNEKFSNQAALLVDLILQDDWWDQPGRYYPSIREIPKLLAYVYHHLYGALNINNERIEYIDKIFQQKIPVHPPSVEYQCLYEVPTVTAFIESLGRNFLKSFNYLLQAYNRWEWVALLFSNEQDFKRALVSYQMAIYLLFCFYTIKNNAFPSDQSDLINRHIIPPGFSAADFETCNDSTHFILKNANFFKEYIHKIGLSEHEVLKCWPKCLEMAAYYYKPEQLGYRWDENFIINLLK